jgi:hypothetical protein
MTLPPNVEKCVLAPGLAEVYPWTFIRTIFVELDVHLRQEFEKGI